MTAPDREAEIRKNIQRGTYEVAGDADVVGLIGEIDRLRDALDEAEKKAGGDLWEKVRAQQNRLSKLEGKYATVKGDLRARQAALDEAKKALRWVCMRSENERVRSFIRGALARIGAE